MSLPKRKVALSGVEKTAILMNVIGSEKSFELMKGMKDPDVRRLLKVMTNMKKAPIHLINSVLREYLYRLSEKDEIIFDENLTEMDLVSKGLGEERAKQIFGTLKTVNLVERKHLTALDQVDTKTLAEYLVEEHPQTIALVVAHLEIPRQIAILKQFPDSIRPEVIMRMANLEYVAPEKVDELDDVLKKELGSMGRHQASQYGGVLAVADLVNSLDKKTMNSVMTRLEDKDPVLAEEIRQHMFTFTDITKIDERGIQLILREVDQNKLLLAMKSAPEELREKIYSSMSSRASEMMREDLNALGPQKVSDVETAQREIVAIVKRLEEEGKIIIGASDDQDIIP